MELIKLNMRQKIVLIVMVLVFILLLLSILSNISKNDSSQQDVGEPSSVVFVGDTLEVRGEFDEEENLSAETSSSGAVAVNFTSIDLNSTSILKYYEKILNYLDEKRKGELLSNLDSSYVKKYGITEENVIELYEKNGFSKGYEIKYCQVFGIDKCIFVLELKNDNLGQSKYVGLKYSTSQENEKYSIFFENYFNDTGFEIKGNTPEVTDAKTINDSLNEI